MAKSIIAFSVAFFRCEQDSRCSLAPFSSDDDSVKKKQ